jgi:hypothetical protein
VCVSEWVLVSVRVCVCVRERETASAGTEGGSEDLQDLHSGFGLAARRALESTCSHVDVSPRKISECRYVACT